MKEDSKEALRLIQDKCGNLVAATGMRLPPQVHVDCLRESLSDIKKELQKVLDAEKHSC